MWRVEIGVENTDDSAITDMVWNDMQHNGVVLKSVDALSQRLELVEERLQQQEQKLDVILARSDEIVALLSRLVGD
jgi:hypothetical protein